MRIILLRDIGGVGKRDEVKNVADGYAFNFLIPKNLAEQATPEKVAELESRRDQSTANLAAQKEQWSLLIKDMTGKSILIKTKANEKGHLYKSVSPELVADEIEKLQNVKLPPGSVYIKEPIRTIGSHTAELMLGGQRAILNIQVTGN